MTPVETMPSADPHRLIVGMPRGGTTAMMRALNADGRVAAFGESLFWGRAWVEPREDGGLDAAGLEKIAELLRKKALTPRGDPGGLSEDGRDLSAAAADVVLGMPVGSRPVEVFEAIGEAIAETSDRRIWVEKTPHHLQHLDRIFQAMPDARVVVMLRSPADFLRSYKHQGDRKAPEIKKVFHRLYHPMLASLVCRRGLQESIGASKRWPDALLMVLLEEVREDPTEVMGRIRTHLRLPDFSDVEFEQANSSFEGVTKTPNPLSPVETTWLRLLVGKDARALDMPMPDRRVVPIRFLCSVLSLIPWGIRNWKTVSRLDQGGIRGMIRRWLR
ncbi:MAG: sulfotransferase [Phycisphaerales bacterium]|nr:sulfotransferase [Phycisphaerales bacterium]